MWHSGSKPIHRAAACGFCGPGWTRRSNLPGVSRKYCFPARACGNCVEQCALTKIKDELLLAFTAGKEALAIEGKVPPPVRDCLTKLQKYGNPYGLARKKRADWAVDTGVETFSDQEYLFFPGDVGAFDSRGQEIARSVSHAPRSRGRVLRYPGKQGSIGWE